MAWGRALVRALVFGSLFVACGGSTLGTGKDEGEPPESATGKACPGAMDAEGGGVRCRSTDECSGNEICQAYLPYPCSNGINSCYQHSECGVGHLCIPSGQHSCVGFGSINICGTPCTETSCAEGQRCEDDGLCRPTPCAEGYECPPDLVCADEGDLEVDEHGCRAASCESDGYTCPQGFECLPTIPLADKNGCMPVRCTAGFECPVNTRCAPKSEAYFAHQCERLSCEVDGDCDCGYCLEGVCRDVLSYCAMPPIG